MGEERQRQEEMRRSALAAAQTLERRGLIDGAIEAFQAAGAPEEVARLLVSQRRFSEAGQLLLDTLPVPPEKVGTLDPPRKKIALQAAICIGRAGEATRAATLFVALGERDRAVEVLKRAGDHVTAARVLAGGAVSATATSPTTGLPVPNTVSLAVAQTLEQNGKFELALDAYVQLRQPQHAGRMALKLGRMDQAGELYVTAGMQYEAAECFWRAGDARRSLDALMRVPREDARYRQSCVLVIRLASDLDALDFQIDHFLSRFLSEPPQSERDAGAFYLVGKLYQRHDHLENAKDAFRKIIAVYPGYRDARAKLDAIEAETRGSAMVFEKILREEEAFRGGTRPEKIAPHAHTLPQLPPLPELPELPSMPLESGETFDTPTVSSIPAGMRAQLTPPPPRRPTNPPMTVAAVPVQTVTVPAARTSQPPEVAPAGVSNPPAPAAATEPVLTPGSLVAGRYRLEAKIGHGGMASVFRAFDLELNELIALKVFTQKVDDEQLVARFKQELSLSRQLNHPNIIRLYDLGSVQGFRYITMELLSGTDLRSKLGKPIDQATGIDYLLQVCSALQHVHQRGVVHRDIKPANLFLTNDGVIKLMDFGIAKRQATPGLTVTGMIAGTPEYMSPEQINGFEKVTASTDLYSLGILAYEIFTGLVPFKHRELMPLLIMHMKDRPPPPRSRNPDLSADLEEIILKLLEKEPERRFSSCAELAGALRLL